MLVARCLLLVVAAAGTRAPAVEPPKTSAAMAEDPQPAAQPKQGDDADPDGSFTVPLGSELQEASGENAAPAKVASQLQLSAIEESELQGVKVSLSSQLGGWDEKGKRQDVKGSGKGHGKKNKGPKAGNSGRRGGNKGVKMTENGDDDHSKTSRKKGGRSQGRTFSVPLDSELQVSVDKVPRDATVSLVGVSRRPHEIAAPENSSPPNASAPTESEEDDHVSEAGQGAIIKVPLDSELQVSAALATRSDPHGTVEGKLRGTVGRVLNKLSAMVHKGPKVTAKQGSRNGGSGHGGSDDSQQGGSDGSPKGSAAPQGSPDDEEEGVLNVPLNSELQEGTAPAH